MSEEALSATVGFTASIFKRGVNFINLPTTLLAQVDSCWGKTGKFSSYKNLIGSFYQPKLVISDIIPRPLPRREMICGYAEILKHLLLMIKIFYCKMKHKIFC